MFAQAFPHILRRPNIISLQALTTNYVYKEQVGVPGFEPGTSCSQSKRATICATPRVSILSAALALPLRGINSAPRATIGVYGATGATTPRVSILSATLAPRRH